MSATERASTVDRDGNPSATQRDPATGGDGATPVVSARKLTVGYTAQPVVREVDLDVRPGEVVALLGPNGAGKTTTLLALSGELEPISGEVLFDGRSGRMPLHRRARNGLAFVPEERSVFKGMSTRDNIRAGRTSVDDVLALFPELRDRMDVRGGLLSGGEQQMLTLGRALSRTPKVLLADELSLGLAPLIVTRLLATLREAADRGCGVLLVEQHVRQALHVADRAYVMRRGVIELSGTASELLARIDDIEAQYLSGVAA
jgi:ABC-type branched-subunit amino acid transport system ATPase component